MASNPTQDSITLQIGDGGIAEIALDAGTGVNPCGGGTASTEGTSPSVVEISGSITVE